MTFKTCSKCGQHKYSTLFRKTGKICKGCYNRDQREYRVKNKNACTRKYEKTENGYLMRTYRNMKSRVRWILKKKSHLYQGLEIVGKEEFYEWSRTSNFGILFDEYKQSGWEFKMAPSIDRIDTNKGYLIENMRWITHSENSRLGAISKHKNVGGKNAKQTSKTNSSSNS